MSTHSLGIGKTALLAHQRSIATISHNIANANTKGYRKQTAVLKSGPPILAGGGSIRSYSIGTGVTVADIARAYNRMQEIMFVNETSTLHHNRTMADSLRTMEALMTGTMENSLNVRMRDFWNAWQDVAHSPDSMAARTVLLEKTATLTSYINMLKGNLSDYRDQISAEIGEDEDENPIFGGIVSRETDGVNNLAAQIQEVNKIMARMVATNSNDLEDRRDQLIRELSEKTDLEVGLDFSIRIDGQLLVSADGQVRNVLAQDGNSPVTFQMLDEDGEPLEDEGGDPLGPVNIAGGTLGAWTKLASEVDDLLDSLDGMAAMLITDVNNLHEAGFDLYGIEGTAFFSGTDADTIAVAITDPVKVAAAATRHDPGDPDEEPPVPPTPNTGDGANALDIAHLAFKQEEARLDNMTFEDYFTSLLVTLGASIQSANAQAADSTYIMNMLSDEIQHLSGVNLDEEMIDMISAQRAYQAAAKIITTADDMLDMIINRMLR